MIAWNDYQAGEHRIECPSCGRGGRDKTAGLTIEHDGKGVLHCFRCALVETHHPEHGAVRRLPTIKPVSTQAQKHQRLNEWGRAFWRDCHPLNGVATQYLRNRHCVIPPEDGHLRYHLAVKHPSGYVGPALVALVTDVLTCEYLSLHRTWITPTAKADLDTPRLPLANHTLKGGCIRLWPDTAVTYGLGIAEGIETALSLAHGYQPVWATIDAGHMAQFPVMAGIETLVIAQDQDTAGMSAASICARRWAEADKEVLVTRQAENDLNDVLREVAA
jgi:putative DNA primase/helicase